MPGPWGNLDGCALQGPAWLPGKTNGGQPSRSNDILSGRSLRESYPYTGLNDVSRVRILRGSYKIP
eukprot:7662105-Pyramimonas_sp.AAC.1